MRLYMQTTNLGEPEFESDLPTDMYARRAIKAQVCEPGLGRYRVEAHMAKELRQRLRSITWLPGGFGLHPKLYPGFDYLWRNRAIYSNFG